MDPDFWLGPDIQRVLMNDPHSYPQPKTRLPPKDQLIMGIHTVTEVLQHAPERFIRLFTEMPRQKGRKSDLLTLFEKKGIPITFTSFENLCHMTSSDSHQSMVAHVKGREFLNVSQFLKRVEEQDRVLVLMVDQIFDPQNFGALLRSGECAGASAVVWSKNRGSDLTPVATKASSGASELLSLIRISNLAEAVSEFQEGGFEAVAALADPRAESAFSFRFAPRTLLIVGSEGEGIQPLIQKRATRSIYIPLQGKIESLNVAQATSVLLFSYVKEKI